MLTSLELRLPRTYLARARGDSGSSRSRSGGSRRRNAGVHRGSIPPARPRPRSGSGRRRRRERAGTVSAPPIKGAAGCSRPRPSLSRWPNLVAALPTRERMHVSYLLSPAPASILSSLEPCGCLWFPLFSIELSPTSQASFRLQSLGQFTAPRPELRSDLPSV